MNKRYPAVRLSINHVLNSPIVKGDDERPSFITVNGRDVYRVMLTAFVSEREGRQFTIDDGTGSVSLSVFDEMEINPGDCVRVIGRVREYGNERMVSGEIVRKCSPEWAAVHKRKVLLEVGELSQRETPGVMVEGTHSRMTSSDIFREVEARDKGDGASIEEIIGVLGRKADYEIKRLVEEGELFEIRPGFVKVLK